MKKLLATGALLLSTALNANSVTNENEASVLLDSLDANSEAMEMVAFDHFFADGDLEDMLGTTTIVEWYEQPHDPFKFIIDNGYNHPKLYIKKIRCAYSYVDVFGQPDGDGSSGGTFRTFTGKTAVLDAYESKCTRKFGCSYTVGVDGYDSERSFETKLDLKAIPNTENMCLTHARIKTSGPN